MLASSTEELKGNSIMSRLGLALVGALAISLAACGRDEDDTLGETGGENVRMDELNALADNAAQEAETEALGTQQQQLQAEPVISAGPAENAAEGVTVEPSETEDDVQGM